MIDRFPYGKAPFWLFVIAVMSTALLVVVRRQRPPRPDLVMAIFAAPHLEAYKRALPRFEREHDVTVGTQLVTWQSLQTRLQNAMLADTEVPDISEIGEGFLGFFTRGPKKDIGFLDLTDRIHRDGYYHRLVESRFSLWTTRGRIYGLPHDVHPVMLAYRRDLVEKLGISVDELDTWDKFVEVGRRVTVDKDGDGILDQHMIDLPYSGSWGLLNLMLQRGAEVFDEQGHVAFNTELTADTFLWYLRQTQGKDKIAYDCGWGQPLMKAAIDGLALFFWAPDWRSYMYQTDIPRLAGKMALMPLPAWEKGGRRTTVWGGTGLTIAKKTKRPELAWELAKFLYFDPHELGKRFAATNIIPPLKDAWDLPEFSKPNPYYSNQPLGRLYAELAPDTPPYYSSPVDQLARGKLDQAYSRVLSHYQEHGEASIRQVIKRELAQAAADVQKMLDRNNVLLAGK